MQKKLPQETPCPNQLKFVMQTRAAHVNEIGYKNGLIHAFHANHHTLLLMTYS